MSRHISILIPTYNRARLLGCNLRALQNQTYTDFDVIVIVGLPRPCGDGTIDIIKECQKSSSLNVELVLEKKGVMRQYNSGLERAEGDIIAFLDDDAIPDQDWVKSHVETYAKLNVGGVAGNVIPAKLQEEESIPLGEKFSEIIPDYTLFLNSIGRKIWDCPIKGLESYLIYISKAGKISYNVDLASRAHTEITNSLLGMGANMSILAEAAKGFRFPHSWTYPIGWEQFLGWSIWKRGYRMVFNPNAKVYHVLHGETLSRNVTNRRKIVLSQIEKELLFYRLYIHEPELDWLNRITSSIFDTLVALKKTRKDPRNIAKIEGMFLGELIGLKCLLSGKLSPTHSIKGSDAMKAHANKNLFGGEEK